MPVKGSRYSPLTENAPEFCFHVPFEEENNVFIIHFPMIFK